MARDKAVPVIISVGDVTNRSLDINDAYEPMQLMLQAILTAADNVVVTPAIQRKLISSIDDISVVATWTWKYADLPALLSEKLGIRPWYKKYSDHGGNQPIKLIDEAACRISKGESKIAVVTGGEALASRTCICACCIELESRGSLMHQFNDQ